MVVDLLPRLGMRELICLLLFTCDYVVSVLRGFHFLWVLGMGYVILLWHSLSLSYNYFYKKPFRNDFAFFEIIRVQFNVKMSMDLFLTTPHVEIEYHIFNAQLFWVKQLVMHGIVNMCEVGSWY